MRKATGALGALVVLVTTSSSEAQMAGVRDRSTVISALSEVAERRNIPLGLLLGFGRIESGLKPGARTGSYKGVFQLSKQEFQKHGGGNIYNARDNANAFANLTLANMARFRAATGRNPTGAELYLMHQQGEQGAAMHLANPNDPAWVNMARTGEGRQKGSRWAKKAIWGNMTPEWKRRYGSVENVKSGDFVSLWKAKYDAKAGWRAGTSTEMAEVPRIPSRRRGEMDAEDSRSKNFRLASSQLKLNKREARLYQRHLTNLYGSGGVDDQLGSRSTLMATTIGFGGRTYLIPTVWDGKVLSDEQAILRAKREGLRNFPKYKNEAEAQKRYAAIHDYMDMDTEQYQNANYRPPQTGMSELDTQSAEMAAGSLPPPPPSFSTIIGGATEPEPYTPSLPKQSREPLVAARREDGDRSGSEFFTSERLGDVFGQPFQDLYRRQDLAEARSPNQLQTPQAPPTLRDLFRVA